MKLFEILCLERQQEQIDRSHYGSWIAPTGEVYPVERFGHVKFVQKNIKMFPIEPSQYPLLKTNNDVYMLAFASGWVRATHSINNEINFEGLIDSFKKLQQVILPSINHRDIDVVVVDKKKYPNDDPSARSFDAGMMDDRDEIIKWMTM